MAKFLAAELKRLVKDVVRAEIPRDQRLTARRSSRSGRKTKPRATPPADHGPAPASRVADRKLQDPAQAPRAQWRPNDLRFGVVVRVLTPAGICYLQLREDRWLRPRAVQRDRRAPRALARRRSARVGPLVLSRHATAQRPRPPRQPRHPNRDPPHRRGNARRLPPRSRLGHERQTARTAIADRTKDAGSAVRNAGGAVTCAAAKARAPLLAGGAAFAGTMGGVALSNAAGKRGGRRCWALGRWPSRR